MTDKLTQEEIVEVILGLGFKEYPDSIRWPSARCFEGHKLEDFPCECNDRPPIIKVQVYPDLGMGDTIIPGKVTFSVFGEVDGLWFEARVFSMATE